MIMQAGSPLAIGQTYGCRYKNLAYLRQEPCGAETRSKVGFYIEKRLLFNKMSNVFCRGNEKREHIKAQASWTMTRGVPAFSTTVMSGILMLTRMPFAAIFLVSSGAGLFAARFAAAVFSFVGYSSTSIHLYRND